jgi:hypothetical protein
MLEKRRPPACLGGAVLNKFTQSLLIMIHHGCPAAAAFLVYHSATHYNSHHSLIIQQLYVLVNLLPGFVLQLQQIHHHQVCLSLVDYSWTLY